MDREDVYKIIDNERDYQKDKWNHRPELSIAGELLVMRNYINKALDAYVGVMGERLALDRIRKVAATGVRCLEHHENSKLIRR